MKNIAVFASHNGSNMRAIIEGCEQGKIDARVSVVISNNLDSLALSIAKSKKIPTVHICKKTHKNAVDEAILAALAEHKADIIFLAGYMKKIGAKILKAYENRIYNLHPSLLPKYGGKGMYGKNVHKAVLAAKETETGITIHRVTEAYDEGEILAQKKVLVHEDDTEGDLAGRVQEQEHIFVVEFLSGILSSMEGSP